MNCDNRKIHGAAGLLGMSNIEMQYLLRRYGLNTSGNRETLCQRIIQYNLLSRSRSQSQSYNEISIPTYQMQMQMEMPTYQRQMPSVQMEIPSVNTSLQPLQQSMNILPQLSSNKYGFNNWITPNPNYLECMDLNNYTAELSTKIRVGIQEAFNNGKQVLMIIHYGDGVKNYTEKYEEYNVLTPKFKNLNYEEKANVLRYSVNKNSLDLKMWSR